MTASEAHTLMIRAARALAAATRAELAGPALEPFEVQAADAWARYVTVSNGRTVPQASPALAGR